MKRFSVDIKVIYPVGERADVAKWLRDAADTVDKFELKDDFYSVVDVLDNGVVREFRIKAGE